MIKHANYNAKNVKMMVSIRINRMMNATEDNRFEEAKLKADC
jgi:hypothetical protein